ncbi:MAG: acyl-CoA dehydrogenase family protein [Actinomycetota bacterium]
MAGEYEDIACMVREFAEKEIREAVPEDDLYPDTGFREPLYARAGEVGFLSLLVPEDAGGPGECPAALAEVLYELSRVDASVAAVFFCQAFAHSVLCAAGRADLAAAEGLIASTVYDDPLDLAGGLSAAEGPDGWLLSGSCEDVALGPVAASLLLPASTGDGTALFLVPVGEEVRLSEPLLTLGLRACPLCDISLDSAPATLVASGTAALDAYVGSVGLMRGPAAAISAGITAGSLKEGLEYCRGRYQGYKLIIDHEQMRAELGRIRAEALASRELFRSACRDGGADGGSLGLAVQLLAGEMAARATTDGVQVLGGYGYCHDCGQEKRMRDAKQAQCFFGCKELMLQDLTAAALA